MIRTRQQARADADAATAEFAELLATEQSDTTGVPRPPRIDVEETVLEVEPFDFGLVPEPEAEAEPGDDDGGGGGSPPNCPFLSEFECASVFATKTKCGHSEYTGFVSSPPKKYLTEVRTITITSGDPVGTLCSGSQLIFTTTTFDTDDCTADPICSGGGQRFNPDETCEPLLVGNVCNPRAECNCGLVPSCTPTILSGTHQFCSASFSEGTYSSDFSLELILSNEYTTDILKDNTIDDLPGFPSLPCDPDDLDPGQGCNCRAELNVSTDELDCTIKRFQYRLTFPAYGFGPCTLNWHEVEYDENDVFVASVARSEVITFPQTFTSTYQVDEPTTNNHYIVVERP